MKLSQLRTVLSVICLALIALLAFSLSGKMPETIATKNFDVLMWGLIIMVASIACKSSIQYLAGGSGIKGAINTLLTNAKPEDKKE